MYLGFKTRKIEFIKKMMSYKELEKLLKEYNLDEALHDLKGMYEILYNEKNIDMALKYSLSAPHRIANLTGEYVVQIIDEFQFLNQNVYDERTEKQIDIAGMYMSFAESKIAPVIVTGSWVTWLRDILRTMLPSRFKEYELKNFTKEEVGDNILSRVLRAEYEYVINNIERELILRIDKEEDLKKIERLKNQLKLAPKVPN